MTREGRFFTDKRRHKRFTGQCLHSHIREQSQGAANATQTSRLAITQNDCKSQGSEPMRQASYSAWEIPPASSISRQRIHASRTAASFGALCKNGSTERTIPPSSSREGLKPSCPSTPKRYSTAMRAKATSMTTSNRSTLAPGEPRPRTRSALIIAAPILFFPVSSREYGRSAIGVAVSSQIYGFLTAPRLCATAPFPSLGSAL